MEEALKAPTTVDTSSKEDLIVEKSHADAGEKVSDVQKASAVIEKSVDPKNSEAAKLAARAAKFGTTVESKVEEFKANEPKANLDSSDGAAKLSARAARFGLEVKPTPTPPISNKKAKHEKVAVNAAEVESKKAARAERFGTKDALKEV